MASLRRNLRGSRFPGLPSISATEEQLLLLGILYGWPQLQKGNAASVPNDREQNLILGILMDRLMKGFGWKNESEMIRGVETDSLRTIPVLW